MKLATLMQIYQAQGGFCAYCPERMDPRPAKKRKDGRYDNGFTRDHVTPLSRGGRRGGDNVVLAHVKCNGRKGNRLPTAGELDRAKSIHRTLS